MYEIMVKCEPEEAGDWAFLNLNDANGEYKGWCVVVVSPWRIQRFIDWCEQKGYPHSPERWVNV